MDDIGVDSLPQYHVSMTPEPSLAGIDEVFAKGLQFDIAWATAFCSSTRTMLHTGQYPFRTGIGRQISATDSVSVNVNALIFPRMLDNLDPNSQWQHMLSGKWHMSHQNYRVTPNVLVPPNSPVNMGYSFHEGHMFEIKELYCDPSNPNQVWNPWVTYRHTSTQSLVQLTAGSTDNLVTTEFDVLHNWMTTTADPSKPWFCLLAVQAPYDLYRKPVGGTFSVTIPDPPPPDPPIVPCDRCPVAGNYDPRRDCFVAAIESFDFYLADFLGKLDSLFGSPWEENITIVLIGDNGTPTDAIDAGAGSSSGKGSKEEGGIRIPFVVAGAAVDAGLRGTSTDALISVVDLFATFASIAGIDISSLSDIDSVDQSSVLDGTATGDPRTYLFSEVYDQNYVTTPTTPHVYGRTEPRMARTKQFKYVYYPTGGPTEQKAIYFPSGYMKGDLFFDLTDTPDPEDPAKNLLGPTPLDSAVEAELDLLLGAITSLLYPAP